MLAYHSDEALKQRTVAEMRAHQEADRIVQGIYWEKREGEFKGCAVGCLTKKKDGGHDLYPELWGIPVQLAWLEDGIFEDLPEEVAKEWPARFLDAIQVGADLTTVWPRFAIWLMVDETWGLVNVTDKDDVKDVCRRVAAGYERRASGAPMTAEEEQAITDAARDARAAWAAWDARDARAARAARAAWAAWDARDARAARDAWDAWDARDARAARAAFVAASADKLIEILESTRAEAATPEPAAA